MVAAFIDPTDFRLNVAARRADTPAVTANAEELVEASRKGRLAAVLARLTRRSGTAVPVIDPDDEIEALRARVALLAMHVDYWRYRSGEHAAARRAAEAEVDRLTEALGSTDRALVAH